MVNPINLKALKTTNFLKKSKSILPAVNSYFKLFFKKITKFIDEPYEKLLYIFILTFIFSFIYKFINVIQNDAFSQDLSYIDSLYFSSITNFTIGYGDILPQTKLAKFAVISQAILFLIIILAI